MPIVVGDCCSIRFDLRARALSLSCRFVRSVRASILLAAVLDVRASPIATYTARRWQPHRHRLDVHQHQRSLRGRAHVSTPERCHNEQIIITAGRCTRSASVPAALHLCIECCVCVCCVCMCMCLSDACDLSQTRRDSRPFTHTHTHTQRSSDTPLDPGARRQRLNSGG